MSYSLIFLPLLDTIMLEICIGLGVGAYVLWKGLGNLGLEDMFDATA